MSGPLRLLALLAHPDDESLGVGPEHPGRAALARIRETERRAAVAVLGVRELTLLDYEDGALDQADPVEAARRIAREIRRIRPHVVVTFAPDGGYGHPDHIAISQFAGYRRLHELSPERHEALGGKQHFYRVFSTVSGGRRREADLFEGLRP